MEFLIPLFKLTFIGVMIYLFIQIWKKSTLSTSKKLAWSIFGLISSFIALIFYHFLEEKK